MNNKNPHIISYENIGLEVECPFNFYFPEAYKKYIEWKSYNKLSTLEKEEFTAEINKTEPALLEKLQAISNELWLLRWVDRYREFVYPATKQLHTHIEKTQKLIAENLLPVDKPLSTHITVWNISRVHAYALLTILEQKFLTPKRLWEALASSWQLGWWRGKWKWWIVYKQWDQLAYGDKSACELRTLKIPMRILPECLHECKTLLDKNKSELIQDAKKIIVDMGLQWKPWSRDDVHKYAVNGNFANIV